MAVDDKWSRESQAASQIFETVERVRCNEGCNRLGRERKPTMRMVKKNGAWRSVHWWELCREGESERACVFLLGVCVLQLSIYSENLYLPRNTPFGAICGAKRCVHITIDPLMALAALELLVWEDCIKKVCSHHPINLEIIINHKQRINSSTVIINYVTKVHIGRSWGSSASVAASSRVDICM